MQSKSQFRNLIFPTISRTATVALAMAAVFALTVVLTQSVQAQTFKVIHNFTGGADGATPIAGLTMDQAGNLYGTAQGRGSHGNGTVFRLAPKGSGWIFTTLYSFQVGSDGADPAARVIFGPDGSLYGTTPVGGGNGCGGSGCGTVFKLQPPPVGCETALCSWTETVLYRFTGGSDGANPQSGDLLIDQSGVIYGTTVGGGGSGCNGPGCGTVFSLSPSGGAWTESVLYSFTGGNDGAYPISGVISDNAGNLYGTASVGGLSGGGTVYELISSGSGWQEKTLCSFPTGEGGDEYPGGGVIFDASGNLYGTLTYSTFSESPQAGVYELTPSNGNWTIIYLAGLYSMRDGTGPAASLVMDAAGNLYGDYTPSAAYSPGAVFKVTPPDWGVTYFGDFSSKNGTSPQGSVILDASGNIYGTASGNGVGHGPGYSGYGTVWKITQ